MRPLHTDVACTRLVAFLDHELDKIGLVKLGVYDDLLSLTDVYADPDNKLGKGPFLVYIHGLHLSDIFRANIITQPVPNYHYNKNKYVNFLYRRLRSQTDCIILQHMKIAYSG